MKKLIKHGIQNLSVDAEVKKSKFRVAIFGSARIKPNDKIYNKVRDLAKIIASEEIDIVTGGGPGIMEAANLGHSLGTNGNSHSIGLTIELPWESEENNYIDKEKHFEKFSNRLDHFMTLSNVVIIMPGGIGTCLELFYTWQLTQVKHIKNIPIILHGKMWHELLKWVKKWPVKKGLVSPEDIENVICVDNNDQVIKIIKDAHKKYQESGGKYTDNLQYSLKFAN